MPYIRSRERTQLDSTLSNATHQATTSGELNYVITKLVDEYLADTDVAFGYTKINEVIGVLECAKLELYRRIAAPLEDVKKILNGDVYSPENLT